MKKIKKNKLKKLLQNYFLVFSVVSIGWSFTFLNPTLVIAAENQKPDTNPIQNLIRARIEFQEGDSIRVAKDTIFAQQALPIFYERRAFAPVWVDNNGALPLASELRTAIYSISSDGLRPADYHLETITSQFEKAGQSDISEGQVIDTLVELELLLTDAFLMCGAHMVKGRINPEKIDPEWFANLREIDMPAVLEKAIDSRQILQTLHHLRPDHKGYMLLVHALETYRELARQGGWISIPPGASLKRGETGPRVPFVRERLILTGDLANEHTVLENFFDDDLQDAVIRFQNRHGLDADGIVGPETLSALNTGVEQRINQILLNLERWRWLPQSLGEPHIIVNIADFSLMIRENDATIIKMRAIVGRPYRRTPVFSDKITYLVINPYWNIPQKLAIHDILPVVQKNPAYLDEMEILVFRGWGAGSQSIDPKSIDWASISPEQLPYNFRQEPGPKNALGQIKFMFPNKFNVYIHDTPSRDLFQKYSRSFSSGCIRIEKPLILAQYLLGDHPDWPADKITAAVSSGIEQTISLTRGVPVHLLYCTAWATTDDILYFRKDIYGRDERLLKALSLPAPENL